MANETLTVASSPTTETAPAESSPAPEQPTEISQFSTEERHEWRKTGNWPERKAVQPKTEGSATSKEPSESASASEAGKQTQEAKSQRQRSTAETRLNELLDDLRASGYTPAELKTLRKAAQSAPETQKPAASSPVAAPQELKEPVEPQLKDFEGKPWEEYQKAVSDYNRQLTAFEVNKAIQADRQARQQEEQSKIVAVQMAEARKAYPDWDAVAKPAMEAIYGDGKPESGAHPAVKHALGRLPDMAHILYVLGGDKELNNFVAQSRRDPVAAIYELGVRHALIAQELGKAGKESGIPARNSNGKFVSSAPEKKISSAPAPAAAVGGNGSPPPDPVLAAQKSGNFTAYRDEANARDLERRKGK